MKRILFIYLFLTLLVGSVSLYAAETNPNFDLEKTPWLKGVNLDSVPKYITPVIPMKINLQNGDKFPKKLTEDEPIYVQADSNIFFDDPPTKDRDMEIHNPMWETKPNVSWYVVDWEVNKSVRCKQQSSEMAENTMIVVPTQPTNRGAVTCHVGRKMSYSDIETGEKAYCYANSSVARDVKIKDITPPTCGLQISIEGGSSGQVFPVENPPDKFPLPKTADLYISGGLFNDDPEHQEIVSGLVLGPDMIAPEDLASVKLDRGAVVKIQVIGDDNYKLDNAKIKYGICAGAGGEPTPICQENQPEYDLAAINIPQTPYFYLDAYDTSGNREILFIPIKIK